MTSDRLDKLILQLETITPKYGHLASKLSDSIAVIEERLASLESKTTCEVAHGMVTLSFGRNRDKWALIVRDRSVRHELGMPAGGRALRTAPLAAKIKAVALIEPLLEKMFELQRDRLSELQDAATLGADLAKRLNSNPKEGE